MRLYLTKEANNLQLNYKALVKEVRLHKNEKDFPCSWIMRTNICQTHLYSQYNLHQNTNNKTRENNCKIHRGT